MVENEFGCGVVWCGIGLWVEVERDDVEACGRGAACGRDALDVGSRETTEDALLFVVDGELGGEGVAVRAGLYFDEAEGGAVPRDEVEVAAKLCGLPAAGDDDVSVAAEMEECLAFAERAGLQVRGRAGAAYGVESAESPALRADPGSGGKSRPAGR